LKKRSKKLLPDGARVAAGADRRIQKFFGSFFQKRTSSFLAVVLLLTGCASDNPLDTPIGWFHDLQGGAIAAQRPPPPGVGLPYPKIVSVPAAPNLPNPAFRDSLEEQLQAQRDRAERIAAHSPVEPPRLDPPPGAATAAPKPQPQPADAAAPAAQASLPMAEPAPSAPPAAAVGPPVDAPVFLVGSLPQDTEAAMPAAPPPPATFEGVPAEPLPTPPPPVPERLPAALRGTEILFLPGEAALRESQMPTLRTLAATRKKQRLDITGLGEAVSDTPDGQAAAIELGLKRAQAVAQAFAALNVPQSAIVLSAYAFGRGATVRLTP
jgi:outer membrane protein OmpA-like peptidoglycan-associated protein